MATSHRRLRAAASAVQRPNLITTSSDLTGLLMVKHARKSTPDPKNPGKSVVDQFDEIDRQTAPFGMVEFARVEEDNQGASRYSSKTTRAKLVHTMDLIRNNPIAVVAFWKLNRGFRRQKVFGEFTELCQDRNVLIWEGGRLFDPRMPADLLSLSVSAVMDENQIQAGRLDTKRGVASTAIAGRPHGRSVYGYRRFYDERGGLERIEINQEHQKILLEIADRVLNRSHERDDTGKRVNSSRAIAADLSSREDAQRPLGGRWHAVEIREILLNPTYYGVRAHTDTESGVTNYYDAVWPPIFPKDQQDKAQRFFATRSRGDHSSDAKYLLTGIAWCVRCDGPMYVTETRAPKNVDRPKQIGYQCRNTKCRMTRNKDHLETYVREHMNRYLNSREFLAAERAHTVSPTLKSDRDTLQQLRAEQAQDELDLEKGEISPKAFTISERAREPKIAELRRRIESATDHSSAFAEYREMGSPRLDGLSLDQQRRIIKSFVKVICIPAKRGRGFDQASVLIVPRSLA